jgi:hypothetical protein
MRRYSYAADEGRSVYKACMGGESRCISTKIGSSEKLVLNLVETPIFVFNNKNFYMIIKFNKKCHLKELKHFSI